MMSEPNEGWENKKMYVEVNADFDRDGNVKPRRIILPSTGHAYEIDKVSSCVRAASRKAGGCGLRYTVMICGQPACLYFEDRNPGKWFVVVK